MKEVKIIKDPTYSITGICQFDLSHPGKVSIIKAALSAGEANRINNARYDTAKRTYNSRKR